MDADTLERLRRSVGWAWECKRAWQASYEQAVQKGLLPSAEFAAKEVAMFEGIIQRYESLLNGYESEAEVLKAADITAAAPKGSASGGDL